MLACSYWRVRCRPPGWPRTPKSQPGPDGCLTDPGKDMPPSGLDPRHQAVAKYDTTSAAGIIDPIWRWHKSCANSIWPQCQIFDSPALAWFSNIANRGRTGR